MSQEQLRRPQDNENQQRRSREERDPLKYGDVFPVTGDLADKPFAQRDAAMMQSAETTAFGKTHRGGPVDVMTCAAETNEQAGLVGRRDVTDVAKGQVVTITGTDVPGARIVTETFAGQVVGQHVQVSSTQAAAVAEEQGKPTIGVALEATINTAGGFVSSSQSAAACNTGMISDDNKIKLKDVLADVRGWTFEWQGASRSFPPKEVTRDDAEAVARAEQWNNPNLTTHPGAIGSSMDTTYR